METSPTLFYNDANQHVAKMVETRIANVNSPWLSGVQVGDIHAIPVSHGEGKFVVTDENLKSCATMANFSVNTWISLVNQVWIQNTIQMAHIMR